MASRPLSACSTWITPRPHSTQQDARGDREHRAQAFAGGSRAPRACRVREITPYSPLSDRSGEIADKTVHLSPLTVAPG